MTPEILSYREYMKRQYYGVMDDAAPAPSNTTANVSSAPVVLPEIMTRHKKRFTEILANVYDKHKTDNN